MSLQSLYGQCPRCLGVLRVGHVCPCMGINDDKAAESPPASSPKAAPTAGGVTAPGVSNNEAKTAATLPTLRIDPDWGSTTEYPDWVNLCPVEWIGKPFSLSGHIGVAFGEQVVRACNSHSALVAKIVDLEQQREDDTDRMERAAAAIEKLTAQHALLLAALEPATRLLALIDAEGPPAKEWQAITATCDEFRAAALAAAKVQP